MQHPTSSDYEILKAHVILLLSNSDGYGSAIEIDRNKGVDSLDGDLWWEEAAKLVGYQRED